jgi:hypothetical protein
MVFSASNGSESARIDSSGNLGIGTTSPNAALELSRASADVGLFITRTGSGAADYRQFIDGGGDIRFNMVSSFNMRFFTANTERARIDSSGNLLVGRTTQFLDGQYSSDFNGNSKRGATYNNTFGNSGANFISFGTSGTEIGGISQVSSTGVLYNTTSDQRLKENIVDADSASSLIDSLQVRQFDWKADGNHQRYGFVAQELVIVAPEAVHQPINEEDMMAVDYSKLVPMLVKEIQSLRKRLAALEAK